MTPFCTLHAGGQRDGACRVDPARGGGEPSVEDRAAPKRVMITRDIIARYGATAGCKKCRGLVTGDRAYQHVHHSEDCRKRLEDMMRNDEAYREQVERAEFRRTERLAEVLERRMRAQDRQARLDEETARKKRKVVHQTEGEKDPSPGGESPAEATPSSSARPMEASSSSTTTTATVSPPPSTDRPQAQDGDGDEMMDDGIPLATPEAINMSGKREATEVGDDEGKRRRPRLQCLNELSDGVEFDISEVFSVPRMTLTSKKRGLRAGYSLDETKVDVITGKKWDLSSSRHLASLWSLLKNRPSRLLVASPPCTTPP